MRASELIKKPQECIKENGDQSVFIDTYFEVVYPDKIKFKPNAKDRVKGIVITTTI